jgi:hypothetical protein
MTNDDIFAMAKRAGLTQVVEQFSQVVPRQLYYGKGAIPTNITSMLPIEQLTAFANLVAEKEREECAGLCDSEATCDGIAQKCATAIRARG